MKTDIEKILASRGIEAVFGIVEIGGEGWELLEYEGQCIAIDPNSGVWVGPHGGEWKQVSLLEAVDYLLPAPIPLI